MFRDGANLKLMDRGKLVPYYVQVAETIRTRILDNEYQHGELIPPARVLEEEFNVSNITVRKALSLLVQEGYLESQRGIGTRVVRPHQELVQIEISGNFRDWLISASGRKPKLEAEILEAALAPCPRVIRDYLKLGPDELVWRMKRIRKMNRQPISYFLNYARANVKDLINPEDVLERSFIEVFQSVTKVKLTKMEQRVEAVVADMDLATLLGINFGDPLFFSENVYYAGPEVMEVTQMYYRGDWYVYKATIEL